MYSRKEIKSKAKEVFKAHYWPSVAAALILGLCTAGGGAAGRSSSGTSGSGAGSAMQEIMSDPTAVKILIGIAMIIVTACVVASLLNILIGNVIRVGGSQFHLACRTEENVPVGSLFNFFKGGVYGNVVKVMFLKGLFISLWGLLFVIPGIIKSLQYSQVEYILSEDPTISWAEARDRSKAMMAGNKMRLFWFELSFIGWGILAALTLGIAGVFWTNPYLHHAKAGFYEYVKNPDGAAYEEA